MLLEHIINQTSKYIDSMPKQERKKYGQFFTSKETAIYMASLFAVPKNKSVLRILDAGAGTGILACALIERLVEISDVEIIDLTCYETDHKVFELLRTNLNHVQQNIRVKLNYHVLTDNYITSQYEDFNGCLGCSATPPKYDLIIGNPPYKKIPKDASEATSVPAVCHGAPNLYFLFATMGLFNLVENGEMVYIIPRSWTSGAYFKNFREYFLSVGKLTHIHLFTSRDKVFDKESVLQETMIVKVQKTSVTPSKITITSSNSNRDFYNIKKLVVPYKLVVSGEERYVYLVTSKEEMDVLKKLNSWNDTLPSIGMRMKTGLTVDFRNRDALRTDEEAGTVPLFYSQHIRDGMVKFPIHKENEYVVTAQPGLLQSNKNYLFIKRFTAKEEKRRLQCGIYLSRRYPKYKQISTQNKINFIDGINELSECTVFGLYVLFNSTLYDVYYRILNGSTQVNSTEINTIPVPDLDTIQRMGQKLLLSRDLSEENCNMILEGFCG